MTLSYRFDSWILTRRFPDPTDWTEQVNTLQHTNVTLRVPDGQNTFVLSDNGMTDPTQFEDSSMSYVLASLGPVNEALGQGHMVAIRRVHYDDGTFTDVLHISRHVVVDVAGTPVMVGFDEIFVYLGGVALPDFTSATEMAAWAGNYLSWGVPSPALYPTGAAIDWGSFDIDNVIRGTTLADTLTGGALNDEILGLAGNDSLAGGEGNDTLNGAVGRDTLTGGTGDDMLSAGAMDVSNDLLLGGAGLDTADYRAVTAASGILIDLLAGSAVNAAYVGTDRLVGVENAIGGAGADTIIGTAGANRIDGGLGADDLRGGTGNDVYVVDRAGDRITEAAGGGTETVIATYSGHVLGANLENLVLDGTVLAGSGNALANRVTGNAAANLLAGGLGNDLLRGMAGTDTLQGGDGHDTLDGGTGADRMQGGAGNDSYLVDESGDRIFETVTPSGTTDAGGRDHVSSSVTINLDAYAGARFVENVTLTGTYTINATGNALNNRIIGNDADNMLAGGLGNDVITTGLGNDVIVFNTALGATNVDMITDFYAGYDQIRLDDAIFTGLARGALAASAFAANEGGRAMDAGDRILFDTATARLYYDADGTGAGARVLVAFVTGSILSADDFLVI
ncbi:calcium-binding protein [Rhodobacter capsulatus]|uniref:calcium-binding protein n=1 Tax=Rhodobacter capsulatus TaxID=1061 RepID=UPI0003D316F6|nr:calcium-binding protein [Rhodobacter capsulatus]ETD76149.1 hypothetical protein U716_18245 [Rhodobacter capsulatus B6]